MARKICSVSRLARSCVERFAGWLIRQRKSENAKLFVAPCGSRLTYERLVTPRFCSVDSNSSGYGRNRCGFKKREAEGGRASVLEEATEEKRGRVNDREPGIPVGERDKESTAG